MKWVKTLITVFGKCNPKLIISISVGESWAKWRWYYSGCFHKQPNNERKCLMETKLHNQQAALEIVCSLETAQPHSHIFQPPVILHATFVTSSLNQLINIFPNIKKTTEPVETASKAARTKCYLRKNGSSPVLSVRLRMYFAVAVERKGVSRFFWDHSARNL